MISKLICNTDSNIYHIMLSLLQIFEGDAEVRNIMKYDFPFFFMHIKLLQRNTHVWKSRF